MDNWLTLYCDTVSAKDVIKYQTSFIYEELKGSGERGYGLFQMYYLASTWRE
jgi:hypothetical protein